MIFKNVELFNIGALIPQDGGGYLMARVPADVRETMIGHGLVTAYNPAGGEIRFVLNSGTAKITLRSNATRNIIVCYGALHQSVIPKRDVYGTENTTIEIAPFIEKEKTEVLHKLCGYNYSPNVIRLLLDPFGHDVIVDVEGDMRPPRPDEVPEKRFLMYGSSITHGCFSLSANTGYVSRLSRMLGYDAYNFGFGSSCLLEPALCDYIAEQGTERNERTWDFAMMELGINTLIRISHEEFASRAKYLLDTMQEKNPDKKLFVTDIYYHTDELFDNGKTEAHRDALRRQLEGRKNIIYTPAKEILGDPRMLCADGVHPSVDAMAEVAKKWYEIIKANI